MLASHRSYEGYPPQSHEPAEPHSRLHRWRAAVAMGLTVWASACTPHRPQPPPLHTPAVSDAVADLTDLRLVESRPTETSLKPAPNARDTQSVWLELIQTAKTSIDLAHFYVSNKESSRLEPVLRALEQAVGRKVRVRLLVDATFSRFYPKSLERLSAAGVDVQRVDYRSRTGGVHHAKYMLVDARRGYVGSANMDYRSLEHIHELGLLFDSPTAAGRMLDVFNYDWTLAAQRTPASAKTPPGLSTAKTRTGSVVHASNPITREEITVVASPPLTLPKSVPWDWPQVQRAIAGATQRIVLQTLSYSTDKGFDSLDRALRAAAKRGVAVDLLVSSWIKNERRHAALRRLSETSKVRVWVATIPQHSSGFIPYARVIHAKYIVVDDDWVWLGSSNLGGSYFSQARNLSLLLRSQPIASQLWTVFDGLRRSPYCHRFDPKVPFQKVKVGASEPTLRPQNHLRPASTHRAFARSATGPTGHTSQGR